MTEEWLKKLNTTLFYLLFSHKPMRRKEVDIAIDAFDAFKKIHPYAHLDFPEACVIIDDLKTNAIELVKCSHCACWNLLNARLCIKERCGTCKTQIEVMR
jgi:hypothetical protein